VRVAPAQRSAPLPTTSREPHQSTPRPHHARHDNQKAITPFESPRTVKVPGEAHTHMSHQGAPRTPEIPRRRPRHRSRAAQKPLQEKDSPHTSVDARTANQWRRISRRGRSPASELALTTRPTCRVGTRRLAARAVRSGARHPPVSVVDVESLPAIAPRVPASPSVWLIGSRPIITCFPRRGREATLPFIGFAEAHVLSAFRRSECRCSEFVRPSKSWPPRLG